MHSTFDLACILALGSLFQCAQRQFDRLNGRGIYLVAMLFDRLFRGVDQAFGLVAGLYQFAARLVGFGIGLGILDHLINLCVRQSARGLDGDLLFLVGAFVLGRDRYDAVCVDVERDLDLRHTARCGRDAFKVELAQHLVVGGHLTLTLEHADRHSVLVVLSG